MHISEGEARLLPHQIAVNHKMEVINRCGEILTVVTLLAGVGLAGIYLYLVL